MSFLLAATVIASCSFLLFSVTFGLDDRTKFTKEPQTTVYTRLGSEVKFRWEFTFAVLNDWNLFDQIIWGKTDSSKDIWPKYITVAKDKKLTFNGGIAASIKSRANWTGNISQHGFQAVFILKNVTKYDMTIAYGCTVSLSGYERKSGPIKLSLYEPPNIIRGSNGTLDVEEGGEVILPCDARGGPKPNVKWTKDGKILQSSDTKKTFQIANIERKDGGIYVCTATNPAGSASYSVLVRVVRYKPYINRTASSNAFVKSWIGQVTTIKCAVDANPLAHFTWFKDGRRILDGVNSRHDVTTLTLTPKSADDFGLYSCKAKNRKGNMSYDITVERLYTPGPPTIYKFTPNVLEFNVTWSTPRDNGGSIVLDYKITLLYANKSLLQRHSGIKNTWFTLRNLQQNRTYIFILQAKNVVGYGEPSNVSVSTLEADPPGPPFITAVPGVLSLKLAWNSSVEENTVRVLDYKIKVMDGTTLEQRQEYTRRKRTSLVVENLKRNWSYVVVIQARNEIGYGESVNITATTLPSGPPDAPSITNITVRGKQCWLRWTVPYNGGSLIETYTVYIWVFRATIGSGYKERLNSWNTTETKRTLELEWAQNYTVKVSAWNKYGESSVVLERHFSTGRVPQEVSSTMRTSTTAVTSTSLVSTDSPVTTYKQEVTSTLTEFPAATQEVEKNRNSGSSTKASRKGTFEYLAPLWIVILAFAVPAIVFVVWKATQKLILVCCVKRGCRCRRPRQSEKDSELGNTSSLSTVEEIREGKAENEYETITEILEVHYNHGYSIENEKVTGSPLTQYYVPGSTSIYDHLYDQPGPGSKTCKNVKETTFIDKLGKENADLKSGLGMFNQNYYSHLGEPHNKRQHALKETKFIVPPTPKWEITRDRLKIKRTIGHGEFGLVKKGCAFNVSKLGGWVPVAVKTLKEGANEAQRKDLLSELQVMKELTPHKHVVELLACITKSEPLCVITEFAPYGDLLGFLRKKRGLKDHYYDIEHLPKRNLTSRQLMKFSCEIADGMAYLSSVKIIHRDLAARNVLLGENLTCKVTDFGMARDIHGQDMYQKNSAGRLPVKWTAMEALIHGRYTTKSDVWSFGVVLFEIFTIGGSPYPGMDVLELIEKLESGYRMEKPKHLHDDVYALMRSCWHEDPNKRLTFRQLYKALNKLDKEIQNCVNLKTYNGKLYEDFQLPLK